MHGADMVMRSDHGAGETFQNDAKSSGRDVKTAGLEPDPTRVRNPEMVVVEVGLGNEVIAAPSIRFEAVGKTVESSNRHGFSFCESTIDVSISFRNDYH